MESLKCGSATTTSRPPHSINSAPPPFRALVSLLLLHVTALCRRDATQDREKLVEASKGTQRNLITKEEELAIADPSCVGIYRRRQQQQETTPIYPSLPSQRCQPQAEA